MSEATVFGAGAAVKRLRQESASGPRTVTRSGWVRGAGSRNRRAQAQTAPQVDDRWRHADVPPTAYPMGETRFPIASRHSDRHRYLSSFHGTTPAAKTRTRGVRCLGRFPTPALFRFAFRRFVMYTLAVLRGRVGSLAGCPQREAEHGFFAALWRTCCGRMRG